MILRFDRRDMRKYLASLKANDLAGRCGDGDNCPIAKCLQQKYTAKIRVFQHVAFVITTDEWDIPKTDMPKWAQKFIAAIDQLGVITGGVVTKRQADRVFRKVTA